MRCFVLSLVAVVVVLGLAMPAQATVIKDVDFSVLPTTLGFTTGGNVDPDTMVNTTTGTWDVNLAASENSCYWGNSVAAGFTQDIVYGYGEVTFPVGSGSSTLDDQQIVYMRAGGAVDGSVFTVRFNPGHMGGYATSDYNNYSVDVSNNDGLKHTYGWEWNRADQTLKLSFDGSPVGTTIDVAGNADGPGTNEMSFGDQRYTSPSAAHSGTWDRWVIGEVPEPSTLVLLGTALLGLVCYAWRKRK